MFKVSEYVGKELHNKVKLFLNANPDSIHLNENKLLWDYVFSTVDIPVELKVKLRKIDIPRIRRSLQEWRNFCMPKTESFFSRQEKAKSLNGRYQEEV